MTELLLWIFAFTCIGLLMWGFACKDRIYQYPFFMGATFVAFILPQAIALVKSPETIPESAIQRVMIMCSLCAFMCWLGYQFPVTQSPLSPHSKPPMQFSSERLLFGAVVYAVIGLTFWALILNRPEGQELNGQSTGIVTIYFFLADLLQIGLVVILLEALRKPKFMNIVLLVFAAAMPVYRAVFFGRREETFFIVSVFALAFYFVRRKSVPRLGAILGIFLATLIIFNIGTYRRAMSENRPEMILEMNPLENVFNLIEGKEKKPSPELRSAALLIETTVTSGKYGLGTGYWDRLIFRWFPAQFFGADFKRGLQLSLAKYEVDSKYVFDKYSFFVPEGATTTGIGDTFSQFDYLGSAIFALIGILFKYLWSRAIYHQSFLAQAAYTLICVKAMLALTHISVSFPADLLYYFVFSAPLIWYAKIKPNKHQVFI
jgi:hypothetical protein